MGLWRRAAGESRLEDIKTENISIQMKVSGLIIDIENQRFI